MPVGQRGQRVHPPPLITLCTDQELLLSSAWLSHLKRRRCLRDLAKVVFVCPSPASLFSLVERWMVGNKKTCARYLWCINKRLRGWGWGGGGGSLKGDEAAGSIPISILLHSWKWGCGYQSHSAASWSEWSEKATGSSGSDGSYPLKC